MFKLIAVGAIRTNLTKAVELKRNTTISAMFHGIVSNNVSFVTDMTKADMADFDTVLRQLLPIGWDKANERYTYSDKKALAAADKLGLALGDVRQAFKDADKAGRDVIVQDFHASVMAYYAANAEAKKAADLDSDKAGEKALAKIKSGVKAALDAGTDATFILDMLAGMGVDVAGYVPVLERTKAA